MSEWLLLLFGGDIDTRAFYESRKEIYKADGGTRRETRKGVEDADSLEE